MYAGFGGWNVFAGVRCLPACVFVEQGSLLFLRVRGKAPKRWRCKVTSFLQSVEVLFPTACC
jgi:hypothetical protein